MPALLSRKALMAVCFPGRQDAYMAFHVSIDACMAFRVNIDACTALLPRRLAETAV